MLLGTTSLRLFTKLSRPGVLLAGELVHSQRALVDNEQLQSAQLKADAIGGRANQFSFNR